MFRFYLDNTLVTDPINWTDFSETIERDDVIKGLLPKYEIKLQFNAGGFDYIYSQYTQNGFCKLVELKVDYSCDGINFNTILQGYIFLTECKFNLNKCIVDCEVEDNNFGARIYRNKSIKVYIDTDKTKNEETLVTTTFNNIDFFIPSTGVYAGVTRKVFEVHDTFRFLIEFMSDNLVGFESTYLATLNLNLISGQGIRVPASGLSPFISFEDLFKEVNKKYPIAFTMITGSDGRPTIKIEEEGYFFNQTSSIQIDNIEDLRQSFNNEVLYSSVKFGGITATFNASIHSFGYIRFLSFKQEEYYLQSECNIDKVLDLYAEFISDSNIIEELYYTVTSNDAYDENVFFIEASTTQATQTASPTTLAAPYYYNASLTNKEVSARYNYNGSLSLSLSGAIVGFMATKNVAQNSWGGITFPSGGSPCPAAPSTRYYVRSAEYITFEDDFTLPNYDTAGNYNAGTSRYTASVAGEYVFQTALAYSPTLVGGFNFNMYYKVFAEFRRFDSGGTLLETSSNEDPSAPTGFYSAMGWHQVSHTDSFTLAVGDYVRVAFYFHYCPVNCLINSSIVMRFATADVQYTWFRTLSAPTSGGVFQSEITTPYKTSKFEFEYPISSDTYNTLKLDLSKSIVFNYRPLTNKLGWIRKTVRKYYNGETKLELISNITNSQ